MWTKGKSFDKKGNIITKQIYTLAKSLKLKDEERIQGLFREIKK